MKKRKDLLISHLTNMYKGHNYNREELKEIFGVSDRWVYNKRIGYHKNLLEDELARKRHFASLIAQTKCKVSCSIFKDRLDEAQAEVEKHQRAIRHIRQVRDGKKESVDLEAVKQVPILEIAQRFNLDLHKSSNNRYFCKIRNEKTPSCCLYEETNSFYDFGSGEGGSNIDFYMKLSGCSFKEAIKEI